MVENQEVAGGTQISPDVPVEPMGQTEPNFDQEKTVVSTVDQPSQPKSLDTVKQMFDSATLMQMEKGNPFKGNKDLNRTNKNRFVMNSETLKSPNDVGQGLLKLQQPIQEITPNFQTE